MQNVKTILLTALCGLTLAGCGDVTVNPPARPVIIEEKKDRPVIIEKTTVEKPAVIIEKK